MVYVLVIGSTGYIGNAVSVLLAQNGHRVYGMARTEAQAAELRKQDITPVLGDITDAKSYLETVDRVSVVIDFAMVMGQDMVKPNRELMNAIAASGKKQGIKKRYIYTSGCLVYGETGLTPVTEDAPATHPMGTWRANFDRVVVSNPDIEGVSVRPGFVYGGNWGHHMGFLFTPNAQGDIEIKGTPERQWAWIHVSDLARAYLAVTEAPSGAVSGQIFNVSDGTRVSFERVVTMFQRASGVRGRVVHVPIAQDDWIGNYSNINALIDSSKLTRLVGWYPRFVSVTDAVELHVATFHAHHGRK